MAQFNYKARNAEGKEPVGVVEASGIDAAVAALQRRNFLITSIEPVGEGGGIFGFLSDFGLFESVKQKDIVILSRQLATLFYVAMVRSGEEAGKMQEIFEFLAAYLERNYDLTSKARNALIYPAFVFSVFIAVIVLMMIYVIP